MKDAIQSIVFRKKTSEYRIERRNPVTGQTSTTYANRLTDAEKLWAKTNSSYHEDPYAIYWTLDCRKALPRAVS